jgi:hypothetical protein
MDSGPFSLTGLRPSQTPLHPSTRSLFRAFFLGPVNPDYSALASPVVFVNCQLVGIKAGWV